MVKNVVVLGSAYAGARAAKLLSRGLPDTHRVVVIDKNSHFNHLYLFSRYGVLPGHAHKAFVPDTGMFTGPQYSWPIAPSPLASHEDTCPENAPVAVHAKAVEITDEYIELDVDVTENTATTVLTPQFLESPAGKRTAEELTVGLTLQKQCPNDPKAQRRIPWDYIAFGTGCEMPRALRFDARTKKIGVDYLEGQCKVISRAEKIVVGGGGALGVQYATDIADLYNNPANEHLRPEGSVVPKQITIVSSRRFLPLYKEGLHDAIQRRMDALGINSIINDRIILPSDEILDQMEANEKERTTRIIRTRDGKEIVADLFLGCTGQRPNSQLLAQYAPSSLNEGGFVRVAKTLRVEGLPRVFALGDVADAGCVKAGHVAWEMGTVVAANIVALTRGATDEDLQPFEHGPGTIKVSLGFQHSASEIVRPGETETTIVESMNGLAEGHWPLIWNSRGADDSDPTV